MDHTHVDGVVAEAGRKRLVRKPEAPRVFEGIEPEFVTGLGKSKRTDIRIGGRRISGKGRD